LKSRRGGSIPAVFHGFSNKQKLMKRIFPLGDWMGGMLRGPRAVYAVAPLFLPLIFASVQTNVTADATTATAATYKYLPLQYQIQTEPAPLPPHSICVRVSQGDTLESLFLSGGLNNADAHNLAVEFAKTVDPRRLRLGDLMRFYVDEAKNVQGLEMKVSGWGFVRATRNATGFDVRPVEAPQRDEEVTVHAEVDSSLYEAIRGAGETPALVSSLVDVFQWDVDFFRLRRGDSFSLVVKKKYVGDDHVGYGPIVAAQFFHNGQTFEAFRYENAGISGYYGRSGSPIKKQFLRAPLKFTRITSDFSLKRFHPVLQRFRPHYGVDYGAPTGTPVMSTADGVVVAATFDRGEGNYVKIRHNLRTETSYLHLSRFASGIKRGAKVNQGDVIGYVGMTGLATGPHLDYRVSENGRWLNPRELKSITADPLQGAALRTFKATIARYTAQIDSAIRVAQNETKSRTPALF
jgi:murein DD-endopeptidase MepM/ murein hydrolase activator NlpD